MALFNDIVTESAEDPPSSDQSSDTIPEPTPVEQEEEEAIQFDENPPYAAVPITSPSKISPSSIPNPSPSVTLTTEAFPNYKGCLYSVPGYSAFQPVFQNLNLSNPPQPAVIPPPADNEEDEEVTSNNIVTINITEDHLTNEEINRLILPLDDKLETDSNKLEIVKTDFEDKFTTEIISVETPIEITILETEPQIRDIAEALSPEKPYEVKETLTRSRLRLKPNLCKVDRKLGKLTNKKPITSKKSPQLHDSIQPRNHNEAPKIEIHNNVVLKNAGMQEIDRIPEPVQYTPQSIPNANIAALISAAEVLNKADPFFDNDDMSDEPTPMSQQFFQQIPPNSFSTTHKPPESIISTFSKPQEVNHVDKNKIPLLPNKNVNNNKILVPNTKKQSGQSLLPKKLSIDAKAKPPVRVINKTIDKDTTNKVVALKRLHQDNGDENDFENLITENQIYGNKIVIREKCQGIEQEQDLKAKISTKNGLDKTINQAGSMPPNVLYANNVQIPNLMMINNNDKTTLQITTDDIINNKTVTNENMKQMNPNIVHVNDTTNIKTLICPAVPVNKETHVLQCNNNIAQIIPKQNANNAGIVTSNSQGVLSPKIVYQIVDTNQLNNKAPPLICQTEITNAISNSSNNFYITSPVSEHGAVQKAITQPIEPEELSSIDLYEKRRRIRRMKYLVNREHNKDREANRAEVKRKETEKVEDFIIKPSNIKAELFIEFSERDLPKKNEGSEDEFDYDDEEDLMEYEAIIYECNNKGPNIDREQIAKQTEFLSMFNLATPEAYEDKQLDRQDRILHFDSIAKAYISAGYSHKLKFPKPRVRTQSRRFKRYTRKITTTHDNSHTVQQKVKFLTQLKLTCVTAQFKEEYEKIWEFIVMDKRHRNGEKDFHYKLLQEKIKNINREQLQLLTEINKSVNENNNLIKKHLGTDSFDIHMLTEKNICELNRLSQLADNSVKLLSGKETKMRDLNPGFDSENIKNVPLNIPDISKINMKDAKDIARVDTTPAIPWPGIEAIIKSYKEHDEARKKEIASLQERNKKLRIENFHATHVTVLKTESTRRRLFAERNAHLNEEKVIRASLRKMHEIIDAIRNYKKHTNETKIQYFT